MSNRTTVIISAGRSGDAAPRKLEQDLAAALQTRPNLNVAVVGHLVDLAPDGPAVQYLQSIEGDLIVAAWLYPRAAYWLLDANLVQGRMGRESAASDEEGIAASQRRTTSPGIGEVPDRTIWCFDLRAHRQLGPLLETIQRIAGESAGEAFLRRGVEPGPVLSSNDADAAALIKASSQETATLRWYPVIDYGRCTNCLECLNFCLFGVFGLDESEQILVEQADACRDGCPACSRVCPSSAIIFPEHHTPVVAGDPTASSDGFNLDLVQLLDTIGPKNLAAAERDRALAEKGPVEETAKDELDELVDDLDKMDL